MPVSASSSSRSTSPVMSSRSCSGRCTRAGCGLNVTATARPPSSRARATMRPRTSTCPRCTPSKLPRVTTDGPYPAGIWSRSVQRSTRTSVPHASGEPVHAQADPGPDPREAGRREDPARDREGRDAREQDADRAAERRHRAPAEQDPTERSEEHTSELQSRPHLVCRLLLEKKKKRNTPKQPVKIYIPIPLLQHTSRSLI